MAQPNVPPPAAHIRDIQHDMLNLVNTFYSFINILELEEFNFTPAELKNLCSTFKESVEKNMASLESQVSELSFPANQALKESRPKK